MPSAFLRGGGEGVNRVAGRMMKKSIIVLSLRLGSFFAMAMGG